MLIDEGVSPDQVAATTWGIVVEVAGLVVRPVECHHWSSGTLSDGRQVVGNPIAFIVETEPGVRIYHYGDTCIFDMRLIGELYRPTVGLLGCTLPRELSHLIPGPGDVPHRRDGRRRGGARGRDARPRARRRLPLPRAGRRGRRASSSSSRTTTRPGRRASSRPLVGETLVVDGDRHGSKGEGAMRLVTYARRRPHRRRRPRATAPSSTPGYADMHDADPRRRRRPRAARRRPRRTGRRSTARPCSPRSAPGKILCSGVNYASHADENPDADDARRSRSSSRSSRAPWSAPASRSVIPRPDDADRLRGRARDGDRHGGLPDPRGRRARPRLRLDDPPRRLRPRRPVQGRADHARQEPRHASRRSAPRS